MIYGYARVSTKGQAHDGNSLENQIKVLKENGATEVYADSFTGTKTDRPEFNKLLSKLQEGDILIVTKLDRFARSMTQGSQLVNELIERGIKVNILNIGIMDNTPSSKLIRNIFFSFAEFERDMIVERTQEGKAIARTKEGFREGRPRSMNKKNINAALEMLTVNGGNKSYKEVAQLCNVSERTLMRYQAEYKSEMMARESAEVQEKEEIKDQVEVKKIESALSMLECNGGNKSFEKVSKFFGIKLKTLKKYQEDYANKAIPNIKGKVD